MLLRPGGAEHALALGERVLPAVAPERDGRTPRRTSPPRRAAAGATSQPGVADAGDVEVPRRTGRVRRAPRRRHGLLARRRRHGAPGGPIAIRRDRRREPYVGRGRRHRQRDRGRPLGDPLVLPLRRRRRPPVPRPPRSCGRRRTGCALDRTVGEAQVDQLHGRSTPGVAPAPRRKSPTLSWSSRSGRGTTTGRPGRSSDHLHRAASTSS